MILLPTSDYLTKDQLKIDQLFQKRLKKYLEKQ